jgi:molybdopterin/thiamine biosynthesis adenylyltransferase
LKDLERYARQIVLRDIGPEGQRKLSKARVLVVGLGGLGCTAAMQLAAMGVGHLRLVDRDMVTRTDMHRQLLYRESDVGTLKSIAAERRLKEMNSEIEVEARTETVDSGRAKGLVRGVDVVVDGLDSIWSRMSVNEACVEQGVPFVFQSAVEMYGTITTILPRSTPCLGCIYQGLDERNLPTCSTVGVHPSLLAVVAGIAVSEAVRVVTGSSPLLRSTMLFVDMRSFSFRSVRLKRKESCPVCGPNRGRRFRAEAPLLEPGCARDGRGTFFLNSRFRAPVDLEMLAQRLSRGGEAAANLGGGLLRAVARKDFELFIRRDGGGIALVGSSVGNVRELEGRIRSEYLKTLRVAEKLLDK